MAIKQKPYQFREVVQLMALDPLSEAQWNNLAHTSQLLEPPQNLRSFQIECSNYILQRDTDIFVIAPTGQGKSLLFSLHLLAWKTGIALVVVPFRSLGLEAETKNRGHGVSSIFLYSEQNSEQDFTRAASEDMLVIHACPEMVESPRFARLLGSVAIGDQPMGGLGNFVNSSGKISLSLGYQPHSQHPTASIYTQQVVSNDLHI
ncbi:hypothetical protein PM082_006157 [Marasmius tenuissimus]|nr:hypothetical protein PM082_006157 [Marasmius tenuissimus]